MPDLLEYIRSEDSERSRFPHLATLMDGWFMQDYELISPTGQGLVEDYKEGLPEDDRKATVVDIERFLAAFGQTDSSVKEAMDRVFYPAFDLEGWEGRTTREWLQQFIVWLSA